MENTLTIRVLKVIDALKSDGKISSDRKFAQKIGLDPTQLSLARNGRREIPDKYVYIISEAFNISKQYLNTGDGEMFTNENTQTGQLKPYKTDRVNADLDGNDSVTESDVSHVKTAIPEEQRIKSYIEIWETARKIPLMEFITWCSDNLNHTKI